MHLIAFRILFLANKLIYALSIAFYATVSTFEIVYVIGNWLRVTVGGSAVSPLIASFKDGVWAEVGSLYSARITPGAIKYGSQVMVIGGSSESGTES